MAFFLNQTGLIRLVKENHRTQTLTLSHIHKPKYMKQRTGKNDEEEDLQEKKLKYKPGWYISTTYTSET